MMFSRWWCVWEMDTQPLWLKDHLGATVMPGENGEGMNPGLLSMRCLLTKEPRFKEGDDENQCHTGGTAET